MQVILLCSRIVWPFQKSKAYLEAYSLNKTWECHGKYTNENTMQQRLCRRTLDGNNIFKHFQIEYVKDRCYFYTKKTHREDEETQRWKPSKRITTQYYNNETQYPCNS